VEVVPGGCPGAMLDATGRAVGASVIVVAVATA
jgi:hypothetical protein